MSNGTLCAMLAIAAVALPAGAMSNPSRACSLVGSEKLPAGTGGPAICAAIEKAIASRAPGLSHQTQVEVVSKSSLKAIVTAGGRTLAQEQLSVMDRNLNPTSIDRFAIRLADAVARARKS